MIVTEGRVIINGDVCTSLSTRVGPEDEVEVDGQILKPKNEPVNILLYKPRGYICSRDDPKGRSTIFELLPKHLETQRNIHYAGRLDLDSEGLIVLTNSGDISQKISHPKTKIEKEYLVSVSSPFQEIDKDKMLRGFEIDSGFARVLSVEKVSKRNIAVTLEQGLNRQIRYMLMALNYRVTRLIRVRIGNLVDTSLKPGSWRFIGKKDLNKLFNKTKD
jgi:23S rRNA pseudouridine2605 synthase|tara:strand:- start:2687 stop:3340 length:654 start_codon:yes stop_codon:yes gene_type:complete